MEIAIAYKHCVPDQVDLRASDLAAGRMLGAADLDEGGGVMVKIECTFDGIKAEHHAVLEEAWRFWIGYLNRQYEILEDGAVRPCEPSSAPMG
jgi:hypothetical protein